MLNDADERTQHTTPHPTHTQIKELFKLNFTLHIMDPNKFKITK